LHKNCAISEILGAAVRWKQAICETPDRAGRNKKSGSKLPRFKPLPGK